jgi:hypothetical protein
LPPESPYHATAVKGVIDGLRQLIRATVSNSRGGRRDGDLRDSGDGRPTKSSNRHAHSDHTVKAA